ncbi:MAG TPA: amidohydrolase family protein [Actinomycetota bacterium]|nr:amidohydrolase family protein [Actinomycetota bacterium]
MSSLHRLREDPDMFAPEAEPLHLHGVVLPDDNERDLYVVDGRITSGPVDGATTILERGFITSGLVDVHAHLTIASPAGDAADPRERAMASARLHLDAGVLAIREPGSPDEASRQFGPDEGLPRVITAGHLLTPPDTYFPGIGRMVPEAELPAVAEAEALASVGWAKVIGDWPGADGLMHLNYRTATLIETARRVHAAGGRIAIHATSPSAVEAAIEASFDSIEHGWGIRPEHFPAMVRQRTALVPTLTMTMRLLPEVEGFLASIGLGPAGIAESAADGRRHLEMTGLAHAAGIAVLAGTDAGMIPHGLIREEIGWLRQAGLPNETALAAASWSARQFLGLPVLAEGAAADIVVYANDPRHNLQALDRPLLMLLAGRVLDPVVA